MGRERANLFLKWQFNSEISKTKWERSIKQSRCRFTIHFITIKNWLLRLYFMHSYCMKLFYCKNLLCLRKERLHIPTLFFYFLFSAPAFLVPATVSCARIPGMFIDNRMCLININTFFLFNLKYVADLTFILRPFWLGTDLTGADWGRFDLESIWLEIEKSLCVKSYLLTMIVQLKELIWWLVLNPSFPFKSDIHVTCLNIKGIL